ncbi:MAG: LAGLIDADG family homing endonuclease [Candidatus Harrisonbacteria bacterium]|nr:LAGLIDADG family homing endonuclease [Candidatus Harrisonbacteria bacterium]
MDITADYIRGLIDGEGCFSFCNIPQRNRYGNKIKIPAFILGMHERDRELVEKVREYLGVKNKVYTFKPYLLDGFKRGKTVRIMVRDFGELRDIIIPFFNKKLIGFKGKQFIAWLEKIGNDPNVHPDYKVLFGLYKRGYFEEKAKKFQQRCFT